MVVGAMHEKKRKWHVICMPSPFDWQWTAFYSDTRCFVDINKNNFWVSINGCQNIYLSKPFAITDGFTIFKTSILSIGTLAVIKRKKSDRYKCTVG